MRSLTIQIPQPCHERWDEMQPTEQGRFCASCQKTVIDYTALSDRELVQLLSKAPETSCGRFLNEQLNRQLIVSNSGLSGWRHWVSLLTMGLLSWQTAKAQLNQTSKPSSPTSVRPDFSVSAIPSQAINEEKKWVVRGRVMGMDSTGSLSPVSEVSVSASQFTERWQTQTDSTGAFELVISTKRQPAELTIGAYSAYYIPGRSKAFTLSSASQITLDDIIMRAPTHRRQTITGGGMCLIKTPSRWQRLKRALFH